MTGISAFTRRNMSEPEKPLSSKELIERAKADRPWATWLLLRSRQLAFAVAMLIMLIFVLLTGGGEPTGQ